LRQRVRRTDDHQDGGGGEAKAPHDVFPVHLAPENYGPVPDFGKVRGINFPPRLNRHSQITTNS
jgi:hypothetical protein